jgi:hypothetical protein
MRKFTSAMFQSLDGVMQGRGVSYGNCGNSQSAK